MEKQNYETTGSKTILPIYAYMLPALQREGVHYEITDHATAITDMVWISMDPTAMNILYLFHAGIHIGKKRAA